MGKEIPPHRLEFVPVEQITPFGVQSLNPEIIRCYTRLSLAGHDPPAVVVFRESENSLILVDGRHRLRVAIALAQNKIYAAVAENHEDATALQKIMCLDRR